MYRIGLSSYAKEINEKLFADYAKSGISAMEISLDLDACLALDFEMAKRYADKYNIDLWSLHLPFCPFSKLDPSSPDTEKRENTVKYFKGFIEKASAVGINKFVVHASTEPIEDYERAERIKYSKQTLAEIAEYATKFNGYIAVEDLPRTCLGNCSSELRDLVSAHERLRVCFDTNHLLGEDIVSFIHNVGDKLITIHVSDYDFINERHWLPGEGDINWNALVDALNEVNYNGVWLYEIAPQCPPTIVRDRDLNCDDFVLNANRILNKQQPDIIGKRKNNL